MSVIAYAISATSSLVAFEPITGLLAAVVCCGVFKLTNSMFRRKI